jgi:hypothetical protein
LGIHESSNINNSLLIDSSNRTAKMIRESWDHDPSIGKGCEKAGPIKLGRHAARPHFEGNKRHLVNVSQLVPTFLIGFP